MGFLWNETDPLISYIKDFRLQDTVELKIRSWKCFEILQCWWISMLPNITWELIFTYALQGTRSPKKQLQKGNRARAIAINGLNQIWAMFFLQQINASMHSITVPAVVFICTCWLNYTQGMGASLIQHWDRYLITVWWENTFVFDLSLHHFVPQRSDRVDRHAATAPGGVQSGNFGCVVKQACSSG